ALRFRQRHEHYAKLGAYRVGLREDAHDFLGGGVGCDVVIGGLAAKQEIAHASADEIGLVSMFAEGADDRDGEVFEHERRLERKPTMHAKQFVLSAVSILLEGSGGISRVALEAAHTIGVANFEP